MFDLSVIHFVSCDLSNDFSAVCFIDSASDLCIVQASATLLGFVKHILEQTGPGWTKKFLQRFESNKMAI